MDKELKLGQLQQLMMSYLHQPRLGVEAENGSLLLSQLKASSKQKAIQGLEIYANAYKMRLIEALSDNFPVLHTLLGDERFFALAHDYIDHNPPEHFSLRYFGEQLSVFIDSYPLANEFPIIKEMAEFEWALRFAFDAADKSTTQLSELLAIPPEQWDSLVFQFHPSLQILHLHWNVPQIWKAVDEELEPIAMEQHDDGVNWLIWRQDLRTWFRSLEVDEAFSLASMLQGASFAQVCESIVQWIDAEHAPNRVAGFVSEWLSSGLISQVMSNQNQ